MASSLIDAADALLQEGGRSVVFRRRAVSTAYYAVFHALAKLTADYVTRSAGRSTMEYERAYRAMAHTALRSAFANAPLVEHPRVREIGQIVVRLQAERERADYLPPGAAPFPTDVVRILLDRARDAVAAIESLRLSDESVRLLAVTLLFRDRRP
ncbi:MAG: hypothetical protein IT534_12945 [Bauldia sp.]|nr:hypothetical protein [Bauldia sp.]